MSKIRLLGRLRNAIRVRQYSLATEKVYLNWVRRFILFHGKRHPAEMGKTEVEAFLSHLAINRNVASSTQNQALQAILFLYRQVLNKELPWFDEVVRAKSRRRVPVVLSRTEVQLLIQNTPPAQRLPVSLMYGAGLRVTGCRMHVHATTMRKAIGSATKIRYQQTCHLPHLASLFCHALTGSRHRHKNHPVTAWPQRPENNNDIYPCSRAWCIWCALSTGFLGKKTGPNGPAIILQ